MRAKGDRTNNNDGHHEFKPKKSANFPKGVLILGIGIVIGLGKGGFLNRENSNNRAPVWVTTTLVDECSDDLYEVPLHCLESNLSWQCPHSAGNAEIQRSDLNRNGFIDGMERAFAQRYLDKIGCLLPGMRWNS